MQFPHQAITRRSFLGASAVVPLAIVSGDALQDYRYRYDHVIGTSLDIAIRARNESIARVAEQTVLSEIRRLAAVLNTRNPNSEISRVPGRWKARSQALEDVLFAYDFRERQTRGALSLRPEGPNGPINVDDPRVILPNKSKATSEMESMIHHFKLVMEGPRPPLGEAYVAMESPKGEKGYYMVSDGTSKPVRWRIRPPSFVNLSAIPKMVEGHLLSDVIAINASIDIVMGEIDR